MGLPDVPNDFSSEIWVQNVLQYPLVIKLMHY
jgi:hypothetical protein